MLLASEFDNKSNYLKADDLKSDSKFRIKSASKEILGTGDKKEVKLVIWFSTETRGLVLNKTNRTILQDAFGDDTAASAGRVIIVYPTTTPFEGKTVPCLRVRIPPPKQATGNGQPTAASSKSGTKEGLDRFADNATTKPKQPPPAEDNDYDDEIPF
jgi:hypothetical protein